MMICRKFLYDLGSRNTTMVLQEAGDGTFMAKWTKIFDHLDGSRKKNEKVVEIGRPKSKLISD